MSSPADLTIKNTTSQSITTNVIRDSWVEGDGDSINTKVIPAGQDRVYRVVAKTGHHGELDIELIGGASGEKIGTFKIKSIKDPQESKNLEVTPDQSDIDMSATGYRHSDGNKDLRRIDLLIAQR